MELYQAPKGIHRPRACSRGWNVGWQGSEFGIGPFDISCLFRGQKTNLRHRPVQCDLTERKIFLLLLSLKYWYPYILYPYMHILHISCVPILYIYRPMWFWYITVENLDILPVCSSVEVGKPWPGVCGPCFLTSQFSFPCEEVPCIDINSHSNL